ncbi:putative periplasmic serine endoprotease DegP-like precursor [Anatilimnocola aggregata]|uniref:Putative periplasmic serine endoprotease DegP-like n=1 Tax=Anatilimnocola aggregata TaxID=2528021 RepID=A0A517YCW7_9BACT|nr:PDZ domain-containing protein [Anatilimnocola aggregata]QDU28085.1 putative periplasmic serine endoprotease DegP-like precursor [Anatilimnocola aggregata]
MIEPHAMIIRHQISFFLFALLALAGQPLPAQEDVTELEERAIIAAAGKIAPAVVRIETVGGLERVGKLLVATGPTTGLIVSEDGYVISSAFNFVQKPTSILVSLPSGTRAAATIVARDHARMLVLLKVSTTEKLPVPVAVPRSEMQVGQWTVAIGRTFEAGQVSMSVGILSAKERIWSKAIQTDAKISPINYGGPLVDIQGRVLGVLAPLSPQGQGGELGGAEWYDSGIGFAIPLTDILQHLPTLKAGKDLHPGLLGISLKPGDIYALPAEIVAVPPNSPASKAGVKVGDVVTAIDGQPIVRQAQLKHALGPKYAGEKIKLTVSRKVDTKDEKVELEAELTDVLIPYEHPLLGVLPLRGVKDRGVTIRYVFPDSPAAEAGLKPGDRLAEIDGKEITDASALQQLISSADPTKKVTLKYLRDGAEQTAAVTLAKLTADIPKDLPPAVSPELPAPAEAPTTGLIEIKLPEEKNLCLALVPNNYHPQVPHGVLVYLPPPGNVDRNKLTARFQSLAEKNQAIILVPQSADPKKWDRTESAFIRKTFDDLMAHYTVDPTRVAIFGAEASGTMAFLTALEHRDRFRGLATSEATPPARLKVPETDPVNRLALLLAAADNSPTKAVVTALEKKLTEAKFPVIVHSLGEKPHEFTADDDALLFRWLDALDRI